MRIVKSATVPVIDFMSNRSALLGRVRLILCLLAFSLFLITAGAASSSQQLPNALYMQPYRTALRSSFGTPPYSYSLISGVLPPGLGMDPSGNITGTPTSNGSWIFQVKVCDSSRVHTISSQQIAQYSLSVSIGLDMYGGLTAMPSPGAGTGYFRVEKNSNGRWMFVDPLGNYFLLQAVFTETSSWLQSGVLATKYGGSQIMVSLNRQRI